MNKERESKTLRIRTGHLAALVVLSSATFAARAVPLNICEVLAEDLLLPPKIEDVRQCDWKTALLIPHCGFPTCMLHPECIITKTVVTAAEELIRAGEVHCSLQDISAAELLEKWVRGEITNTVELLLGGLPHAILNGLEEHFQLLALRGSSLPAPVQQIVNSIATTTSGSGLSAYTSGDVRDIRIISGSQPDAGLYLLDGVNAITLGPVIVMGDEHFQALVNATGSVVSMEALLSGGLKDNLVAAIDLMVHEMIHVRQYRELGRQTFIENYLLETLVFGYGADRFESEAFRFAAVAADLHGGDYCDVNKADHDGFNAAFQLGLDRLSCYGWYVGDFNGDGAADIFRQVNQWGGAEVLLSDGSTQFTLSGEWSGDGHYGIRWYVGDFNGDGADDVFRQINHDGGADMFLSNSSNGFVADAVWTNAGFNGERWYVGDFNGDGADDIFRQMNQWGGAQVLLADPLRNQFVLSGTWTTAGHRGHGWYIGDFNGDGADDIFRQLNEFGGAEVLLSNTVDQFTLDGVWSGASHGGFGFYVGDFNGDGADDIFRQINKWGGAEVLLSGATNGGNQFVLDSQWSSAGHRGYGWYIADFDGDGADDLLRQLNEWGGAEVMLSDTATQFGTLRQWTGAGHRHRGFGARRRWH